ncbi:hypothetical protein QL285_039935 [Trifolium repens]|nr:hypothetical protein QL285_039935 [Trifolium repens]
MTRTIQIRSKRARQPPTRSARNKDKTPKRRRHLETDNKTTGKKKQTHRSIGFHRRKKQQNHHGAKTNPHGKKHLLLPRFYRKELEERWCGGPPSLVAPPTAGIYIEKLGFGSRVEEAVRRKFCAEREGSVDERESFSNQKTMDGVSCFHFF